MPIFANENGWILETRAMAYALGRNSSGRLVNRYWGARLERVEDYPPPPFPLIWASFDGPGHLSTEEYPAYGGTNYTEPCLKVAFPDGVRDTVLDYYASDVREGPPAELIVRLRDRVYPLEVALHYRVHAEFDLLERWVELKNMGAVPVTLERVLSAQWHLPRGDGYRLTHLAGRWYDEFHIRRERLLEGTKRLESRRLTTGHQHNPWFAIDRGLADEEHGDVWFGALGWSGNWLLLAEVTGFQSTRLSLGVNDWDFAWRLGPGETFETPPSYGGYTQNGFGQASRSLHDFTRQRLLPHGQQPHKVLYNSWEATFFKVDEPSQAQLAGLAADMGVELFVMDDGWFHDRNSDNAGLGDWQPDVAKFPHGLQPLIRTVNGLGMDFGLWIEPEMVNPDSDLYRAHPDWVIHFPTRERTEARSQLILNFARPDVQDFIIQAIDKLLTENNIAFIKWDMNRNVSEPGWPDAPGDPRELWVRYVHGLYRVWGALRERHPTVLWQSCSGGGGRADLGILRLADQIWISDNTEAGARLSIQEGFSMAYPANTMEAWVTDTGKERFPLEFRFHASMCGSLGIGGHLLHWSEAERAEAAALVARYKEIRPIVQLGDQYRLRSPQEYPFSAVQYLSKDRVEGVLFVFRLYLPIPAQIPRLKLRGLDPQAMYQVDRQPAPRSGAAWMQDGLVVDLLDFHSALLRIRKVGD